MSIGEIVDHQLLRGIAAGSERAATLLVQRYQKRAYQVAYGIVLDSEMAKDVVQDAFLKLIGAVETFDPRHPFWPWFRRIVVNTALNSVREAKRRRQRERESVTSGTELGNTPGLDPAERDDFRRAFFRALNGLSEELRATFVLRVGQGLGYREIAETLGVPTGTVMSRLARTREILKSQMKDYADAR